MEPSRAADESKVLVIYTGLFFYDLSIHEQFRILAPGGTIGMLVGQHGYVPEPNFLTETLRCQTRFHDPFQESLFSHSDTVQGYRTWSSGRSSPLSSETIARSHLPDAKGERMLVRSTRPIGQNSTLDVLDDSFGRLSRQPECKLISKNVYEAHLPALVTPRTRTPNGTSSKAIRYTILEVSFITVY